MFSNEIKVNGVLIGHLYCHRKLHQTDTKTMYFYRYYRIEDGKVIEGTVYHKYEEGIEKLQEIIFSDIFKKMEKERE
jgi:hypothetical protein